VRQSIADNLMIVHYQHPMFFRLMHRGRWFSNRQEKPARDIQPRCRGVRAR
jgi:hypothetical protein